MANIINVGSGKKRHIVRTVIISVLAVVILAGGGYVVFVMKPWAQKTQRPTIATDSRHAIVGKVNSTNYNQAITELDNQASSAKDSKDKLFAYYQQCSLALNAKKYDDALHYAQLADSVTSSAGSLSLIAASYAGKGDKQQAIAYYNKAISQSDAKTEQGQLDIRDYQKAIAELGS